MAPRVDGTRRVDMIRKWSDDPTQYDSWEYLYNLMKQREKQQEATAST
jgi:hypothetical protein